jgi:hypothetical protein|tara:strand:+ start:691 stop:798 length:108 start_codon:yes stop_codon:yes gene_type:complete
MKFDAKILELLIAWKLAVETKTPPSPAREKSSNRI